MTNCEKFCWDTFNAINCGYAEMQRFENDSLYLDASGNDRLQLEIQATRVNDTIKVFSLHISEFSFGAIIEKDSCLIILHTFELFSNSQNYTSKDTIKADNYFPCLDKSLTLVQVPKFIKGEIIEGVIEFKSKDYWYWKKEENTSYRVNLKLHFRIQVP